MPETQDGAERPGPKEKATDFALFLLADGGSTLGSDGISERDAGALRMKQWGRFARKHGLDYLERPAPEDMVADPRLSECLASLRGLGYPLNAVAGLLQGEWRGCAVTGLHTHDATGDGRFRPYRLVATRLRRERPDLVHDKRLSDPDSPARRWYPALERYRLVAGPPPPKAKQPGLLGRTRVGKALGEIFGPVPPQLHTASPEFAERFVTAAYQGFDARILKYDWAVRGSWLVFCSYDGQAGLIDNGKRTDFLDAVALVRDIVERS